MRSVIRPLALAAALFSLAACVTAPNQPLDKSAHLASIAVATPTLPDRAYMFQAASGQKAAVALGGMLGGIAIAAVQADRQGKFKEAVDARGYSATNSLGQALVKALPPNAAPTVVSVERKTHNYLPTPPQSTADAVLDVVVISYGYSEAGGDDVWRPTVALKCRLVRPSDGKVLMETQIESNAFPRTTGATKLEPLDAYAFPSFQAILADPDKAIAGIDQVFASASTAVAAKIQQQ